MALTLAVLFVFVFGGAFSIPDIEYEIAEATEGGQAKLPCVLTPIQGPDKANVVMWYRGSSDTPMYKYDLKGSNPQHWSENEEKRYFLRVLENSDRAEFTISPIRLSDEDHYHCRVDFFRSPSRVTHVNLTVIGESLKSFLFKKNCL